MQPETKFTIKHMLDMSIERFAENTALAVVGGDPMTYAELGRHVAELSDVLHERGVTKGDRVAILGENTPNWCVAYLAVTTMGATVVPILPDFAPSAIKHILHHSGARFAFVSQRLCDKLEEATEDLEDLLGVFLLNDFSLAPLETSGIREALTTGRRSYSKLKERALKLAGRVSLELEEDDLAAIVYTSGTTGHSKGVMLTHRNIASNVAAGVRIGKPTQDDRMLSILPLAHTFECTLGFLLPLSVGAQVWYLQRPPTAKALLPAMAEVRPTMMLTVPLVIEKIFKVRIAPKFNRGKLMRALYKLPFVRRKLHAIAGRKLHESFGGKLHFFGIGGAALAPEVERFLREGKFPYCIGYGMTEASPLVAGTAADATRPRAIGPKAPGVEIVIESPNPATGEGEVLVKGPNVMQGYFKDPERTAEVFTEEGWLRTGDLGVLKDGYLTIKGRSKNVIVGPSGENIYPEEVEYVINESPYVLESLVFEQAGQLVARVHLNYEELDEMFARDGLSESEAAKRIRGMLEELRVEVNGKVSAFSRLHKVLEQTDPFEKTPTHKIKRFLYTPNA